MKNSIKLSSILLLLCSNIFAQIVKDSKGHFINSKGDIYLNGLKVGFITKDSLIKNAKGKKIAFLKANGTLEDVKGKNLGHWGKDGRMFYNDSDVVVLQIRDNTDSETCDILDANGKKIGNVHDSYKGVACALHCFENRMDMKKHKKIH